MWFRRIGPAHVHFTNRQSRPGLPFSSFHTYHAIRTRKTKTTTETFTIKSAYTRARNMSRVICFECQSSERKKLRSKEVKKTIAVNNMQPSHFLLLVYSLKYFILLLPVALSCWWKLTISLIYSDAEAPFHSCAQFDGLGFAFACQQRIINSEARRKLKL